MSARSAPHGRTDPYVGERAGSLYMSRAAKRQRWRVSGASRLRVEARNRASEDEAKNSGYDFCAPIQGLPSRQDRNLRALLRRFLSRAGVHALWNGSLVAVAVAEIVTDRLDTSGFRILAGPWFESSPPHVALLRRRSPDRFRPDSDVDLRQAF